MSAFLWGHQGLPAVRSLAPSPHGLLLACVSIFFMRTSVIRLGAHSDPVTSTKTDFFFPSYDAKNCF